MSLLALLLVANATANDAPLEVKITDPNVVAMVLDCGGGNSLKATVQDGVARFSQVPTTACTVNMVRRTGTIDEPGKWTCGFDSCSQDDVHHTTLVTGDGLVNVVVPDQPPGASLELKCPNGYRERSMIQENTAKFTNVPNDQCTLMFKGGVPARYSGMTWGTWYCSLSGTTAVCTKK